MRDAATGAGRILPDGKWNNEDEGGNVTKLTRRLLLGAVAAPFFTGGAQAQSWPNGPIRLIVPFPPGGSTHALARLGQTRLQQRLGVNIIIENTPGASGAAGTAVFAKSPPDGNTWLVVFGEVTAAAKAKPDGLSYASVGSGS